MSLLVDVNLTPAAKVLWLAMRADSGPVARSELADGSGLTLPTIRYSLAQLAAAGWYLLPKGAIDRHPSAATVVIPTNLLQDRRVRPGAKLLFGILQTLPTFRDDSGEFAYRSLSNVACISVITARQCVHELDRTGWIQASQAHKQAPVRFTLRISELDQGGSEVAKAKRRLEEADFRGEAIMREYLTLLIDSDEYEDNARPGFLVNPLTDERMELDRYYPPVVAFEFNGPQHYHTTQRFSSQQSLVMQQARDLMKGGLCAQRNIRFVVIEPKDLRLETIRQAIGASLPLRDLRDHAELVRFLERVSRTYRG